MGVEGAAGLDLAAFGTCLKASATRDHIEKDMEEGRRVGLRGTPTILFNGRRYDLGFGLGADELARTIDELLAGAP